MAMDWSSWLMKGVYGSLGVCGMGLGLLYMLQEKMLYVPRLPGVPSNYWLDPSRYSLGCEIDEVVTTDGVRLQGWMLFPKSLEVSSGAAATAASASPSSPIDSSSAQDPLKKPATLSRAAAIALRRRRPTLLFFQENAGNISFRLPFFGALMYYLNCNIYAISYRGYGLSEGKPSEVGLRKDASAALRAALAREDVDPNNIVVYGRSLGGAVAIHLLAEDELARKTVRGLVIENTFTSVEDMAGRVVPPLGYLIGRGRFFNFLVTNKWHNEEAITRVAVPTMLMASLEDEMVPAEHMHRLHDVVRSASSSSASSSSSAASSSSSPIPAAKPPSFVRFVELPKAHHMDAYDTTPEIYWPELQNFFHRVLSRRSATPTHTPPRASFPEDNGEADGKGGAPGPEEEGQEEEGQEEVGEVVEKEVEKEMERGNQASS